MDQLAQTGDKLPDDSAAVLAVIPANPRGKAKTAKHIALALDWIRPGDGPRKLRANEAKVHRAMTVLISRGIVEMVCTGSGTRFRRNKDSR